MKKHYFWAFMLVAPAAFVGCSDIDLNDVNTDVTLPVNDLSIPISLDKLELGTMLDVENDGMLREINGNYAVVMEGKYQSDAIHVPAVTAQAEKIGSVKGSMTKTKPGANSAQRARRKVDFNDPKVVAEYVLPKFEEAIKTNATKIDAAIQELKSVKADTKFHFSINIDETHELFQKVKKLYIKDFSVQLPRGIVGSISIKNGDGTYVLADYSSETGLVSFEGKNLYTTNGVLEIEGKVEGFNADLLEEAFHGIVGSNARGRRAASEEGTFGIDEKFGVKGGKAVVYDVDFIDTSLTEDEMFESLPSTAGYSSQGEMEDVKITEVSGSFVYKVDDFSLNDVSFDDVPDVLKQSGTNLKLDNPQIYVNLNNPLSADGKPITVSTDIAIETKSKSGVLHEYKLEGSIKAETSDYFFYLSPKEVPVADKYEGFENAKHIEFKALADVLSCIDDAASAPTLDAAAGEGLPASLSISATNTQVVGVDVENFQLDQDYFVNGKYAFVAPLALGENSHIKYTTVADGWHSSVEGVVITKLGLNANITTDVPFELQFRVTPINERGERIEGVYSTLIVPANAKNAPIELVLEGDIHDLDGVKFEALAVSKEARPLSPNMNISISGLKVKVSGKYEAEL